MSEILGLDDVEALTCDTLRRAGASDLAAGSVARAIRMAERDGLREHGLRQVPAYVEHLLCGTIAGRAEPELRHVKPAAIRVDAGAGFADPAMEAGFDALIKGADDQGMAAMTVFNGYGCGFPGHPAERIAEAGMLGLCFTNAPARIAALGEPDPMAGPARFALGVPGGPHHDARVIVMPASAMATAGAFDIGLMAQICATCLAGVPVSRDVAAIDPLGTPPLSGHCCIAIETGALSGGAFMAHMARLTATPRGIDLPGRKARALAETNGVAVPQDLLERIINA
ncbi:Ldh family oxidoreductase [Rhodophyticola sp. CCM32]|uniref:Ldh family oxidoreductase n=1 Tax=Rhodophyticola sp. CCM32 TaxID=2916397 RepID=UPI00107FB096|nr:Ldh family oxidoreductase [Rhodophyticola sp. CCM32]QBX99426.1 Ldh family oxidoreductase [Rhodophyticola sp. CCM32]